MFRHTVLLTALVLLASPAVATIASVSIYTPTVDTTCDGADTNSTSTTGNLTCGTSESVSDNTTSLTNGSADVNLLGDAQAETLAVSGTGNATCTGALCTAVSGTGNATAESACASLTIFTYCDLGFAMAIAGNATGSDTGISIFGDAQGNPTAISIFGDASTCSGWSDCMAIAVFGNATGETSLSMCDSYGVCIQPPYAAP